MNAMDAIKGNKKSMQVVLRILNMFLSLSCFLHVDAHTNAKNATTDLKKILSKNTLNITISTDDNTIGNTQYPRTHKH